MYEKNKAGKFFVFAVVAITAVLFLSVLGMAYGSLEVGETPETHIENGSDEVTRSEADVPTLQIGSSWTYYQNLWQNDTEEEEYVHLEEEITYTVESIEHFSLGDETYLGYNVSVDGDILDGEIDSAEIPVGTIDIDGGYIDGYQFLRMSDLAIVEDRQFRYYHAEYQFIITVDVEGWLYMNQTHRPPTEYHDFPVRENDLFMTQSMRRSWGYSKVVVDDDVDEEHFDDMIDYQGENTVSSTETVGVPAGSFETYPITKTVSGDEEGNQQRWYCPDLGLSVKQVIHSEEADMIMELTDHDIVESANTLEINPSEQDVGEEVTLTGQFPDHPGEDIVISILEGAGPRDEWEAETDRDGNFEKVIEVPVAQDMTENPEEFSSVGLVAEANGEYAVATLVTHHDNRPVLPEPEDGAENVGLDTDLRVLVGHDGGEDMDVTFYDASDESPIGSDDEVASGTYAVTSWHGLEAETTYEWYVVADDGDETYESETWSFTTTAGANFEVEIVSPVQDSEYEKGETVTVEYAVTNTGADVDTQTIEFTVNEGVEDSTEITLEVGDTYEGDFTWIGEGSGDYVLGVFSENDHDEVSITVLEEYQLIIDAEEGGTTDPEPGTYTHLEGEEVTLEAIPDEDWLFVEWMGYDSTEKEITITMDRDIELLAVFGEPDHYQLTIDIEGEGEVEVDPDEAEYVEGTEVSLTAIPGEGYEFVEWTGDVEGTSEETTVIMDDHKDIIARFQEEVERYTLDVTIEGEGAVEVEGEMVDDGFTLELEEGEHVTMKAHPEDEWQFMEWTGDVPEDESGYHEITVFMDEDKDITANFYQPEWYELTINIEGEGVVELDPAEPVYEEGTEVTLTAVPDEGYKFVEWTGDVDGTDTTMEITMDADKDLTAHFQEEAETYDLTINIQGEGNVTVEYNGEEMELDGYEVMEIEEGTEVTLTAVPHEDWLFSEWDGTAEEDEEDRVISFTMEEDMEITANFEEDDDDDDTPGFTFVLLALALIATVAIYHKKKG